MKTDVLGVNGEIHSKIKFLVREIERDHGCSQEEALLILIKTKTYEDMIDKTSKLFCESDESILNMLNDELNGNK